MANQYSIVTNPHPPAGQEVVPISDTTPMPVQVVGPGGDVGSPPTTNIQASGQFAPVTLFDALANQAGTTQLGLLFPTTIAIAAGGLPALGSGKSVNLTNAGNICGAIFAPDPRWDSVLLDFAGVGTDAGDLLTIEIGRLKAPGAVPDVLASVVLTTSGIAALGPTAVNPFTGLAHASVTYLFFDATAITAYSALGDLLQAVSGTSGNGLSQLLLNVHAEAYYYVLITALDAAFSEVLAAMTPVS